VDVGRGIRENMQNAEGGGSTMTGQMERRVEREWKRHIRERRLVAKTQLGS
jgi:hypothetical protein